MHIQRVISTAYFLLVALLCLGVGQAAAENALELEASFKGNQEQPKVLYIVPWRKIEGPETVYAPLQQMIEQNLVLIDREEFQRRTLRARVNIDAHAELQNEEGGS